MRKMVFLITLLLLFSGVVCAHRPIFVVDSDPVKLANPDISWAIYSDLEGGEVDYYQFQVSEQGLDFFTQLLVPTRKEYEDFRPTVALIGPGLPSAPNQELPFTIPQGSGAIVLPWQQKQVFFEPFTQTRYYMAEEMRRNLSPGTWRLAVYHPQNQGGKYTLTVGEREEWSWKDILSFPVMWFKTRWWYSPGQTIAIMLAGITLLALVIWFIRRRA